MPKELKSAVRNRDKIIAYMRKKLDTAKFKHSVQVAATAEKLALAHNIDSGEAYIAGLMHDIGRSINVSRYKRFVKINKIKLKPYADFFYKNPFLLHGIVGSIIAKRKFCVTNKDILLSIAGHTLGSSAMGRLQKIVYLADMVSPDRRYKWVKELKEAAFKNLDKAMLKGIRIKVKYLLKHNKPVFPGTIILWNELIK